MSKSTINLVIGAALLVNLAGAAWSVRTPVAGVQGFHAAAEARLSASKSAEQPGTQLLPVTRMVAL